MSKSDSGRPHGSGNTRRACIDNQLGELIVWFVLGCTLIYFELPLGLRSILTADSESEHLQVLCVCVSDPPLEPSRTNQVDTGLNQWFWLYKFLYVLYKFLYVLYMFLYVLYKFLYVLNMFLYVLYKFLYVLYRFLYVLYRFWYVLYRFYYVLYMFLYDLYMFL